MWVPISVGVGGYMTAGNVIYYVGIAILCLSFVSAMAALVVFKKRAKRLNDALDQEYGKRAEKGQSFR